MNKIVYSIAIIFLFLGNTIKAQSNSDINCPIIPRPVVYQLSSGDFGLVNNELQINTNNLPTEIGFYLKKQLESAFSIKTNLIEDQGVILFKKIKNVPYGTYSINISDNITITYSSEESCFYAVNSLLQLIEKNGRDLIIKKCFINDYPKFEWRGMHLDVSRHFFTTDEVKRYIDLMALYKFNTLHWHLTDDQGWRIEIKQFPKLTEIGACRDSTLIGYLNDSPRKYERKRTEGFYTQEQIKEIVDYASKRYISIVPEIEMPGHSRAALAAYPEFSCTGKQLGVPGLWGQFEDVFCSKPQTIEFIKKILDEVIPLFPSKYIHIGGEEVLQSRWLECSNCTKVIEENKLTGVNELQSFFVKQIETYLTSKGKVLIGRDLNYMNKLSGTSVSMLSKEITSNSNYYKIANDSEYCNFNQIQYKLEKVVVGSFLPLEKVYEFNPIPKNFTNLESAYILGGQANVWTEYISSMFQLEYMVFPRALAMSQVLWCREQKPSFESFKKTLIDYQFPFLYRYKVNYSIAILNPEKVE